MDLPKRCSKLSNLVCHLVAQVVMQVELLWMARVEHLRFRALQSSKLPFVIIADTPRFTRGVSIYESDGMV